MKNLAIGFVAIVVLLGVAGGVQAQTWTGSGASAPLGTQIQDGGTYWTPLSLGWSVLNNGDGTYTYSYTFDDAVGTDGQDGYGVADFLLGTGPSFAAGDIQSYNSSLSSFASYSVGTFHSTDSFALSSLPGTIYGIDFNDGLQEGDPSIVFTTDTAPVWGDFYAANGDGAYGIDSNFTSDATTNPFPLSTPGGTVSGPMPYDQDQILVPGDPSGPTGTPEPGSLALGLCALATVAGGVIRRRRRRE